MKDIKVAVVQDSPILFDLKKSIDKVSTLSTQAKNSGAELVLFPEAYLPAYPRGLTFGTIIGSRTEKGRELWQLYYDNSMEIGDSSFQRLSDISRDLKVYLVIGIIEKVTSGTLYCTILYFNPSGRLLGKHRKLKPTAAERIIWGEGAGDDLDVYDTELGKLGGLVCWENYMPLARTWLYQQSIEIYCAPTADHRDSWQDTLKHIALEGRCYVLGCNQYVTNSDYPKNLPGEVTDQLPETLTRGGSVIIDPLGQTLAGPIWDKSGIIFADLKSNLLTQSKMDFDPVGHYARNDVFELIKKV